MMRFYACLFFTLIQCCEIHSEYSGKCVFRQRSDHQAMKVIEKLEGKRYYFSNKTNTQKVQYYVGICTGAEKGDEAHKDAGAMQIITDKKGENTPRRVVIGKYTDADFISGPNWLMLTYHGGEHYSPRHCNASDRTTNIMVMCDENNSKGTFTFHEENSDRDSSCYYQFVLMHEAPCPVKTYTVSAGSIICIVFFSVAAVYLIVGVAVQRCVRGARGWEQVPNITFWRAVGNYSADGCDLVFRTSKSESSREYRGVNGTDFDQEIPRSTGEPDDHLLSM